MSRCRTGHGPMDWSEPDRGYPVAASGAAYMAGEMVTGSSGSGRDKAAKAAYMKGYHARRKVDPNDYPRLRWEDTPRCGATLRMIGEPCARTLGHKDHHKSQAALDNDRRRRAA